MEQVIVVTNSKVFEKTLLYVNGKLYKECKDAVDLSQTLLEVIVHFELDGSYALYGNTSTTDISNFPPSFEKVDEKTLLLVRRKERIKKFDYVDLTKLPTGSVVKCENGSWSGKIVMVGKHRGLLVLETNDVHMIEGENARNLSEDKFYLV